MIEINWKKCSINRQTIIEKMYNSFSWQVNVTAPGSLTFDGGGSLVRCRLQPPLWCGGRSWGGESWWGGDGCVCVGGGGDASEGWRATRDEDPICDTRHDASRNDTSQRHMTRHKTRHVTRHDAPRRDMINEDKSSRKLVNTCLTWYNYTQRRSIHILITILVIYSH